VSTDEFNFVKGEAMQTEIRSELGDAINQHFLTLVAACRNARRYYFEQFAAAASLDHCSKELKLDLMCQWSEEITATIDVQIKLWEMSRKGLC